MAVRGRRPGVVHVRAVAKLAWGIDLHTGESGQVHESIADKDLIDPFTGRPDLDAVVAVEPHGRDFDGDLLVITRTITWAGVGLEEITAESATEAETASINAALDYLGYTGPREIRLLLELDYV